MTENLEALRYPIGPMPRTSGVLTDAERAALVQVIEQAPARVRALTAGLTDDQLERSYRPDGWTVRQLVHHLADSHVNSYVRQKLAVTEDLPGVKTYDDGLWADLPDAKAGPIEVSLALIDALHRRWVAFLRSLSPEEWRRAYTHPALGTVTIDDSVTIYAWHCRHHTAHIELAINS